MRTSTLAVVLAALAAAAPAPVAADDTPARIIVDAKASSELADRQAWGALIDASGSWCVGKDDGTGETVTFTFASPIAISAVGLRAGRYKSTGSYPTRFQVTAGKQKVDGAAKERAEDLLLPLDGSAVSTVTIKITGVEAGATNDTCLSHVRFQTAKPNTFYPTLHGLEPAAFAAFPDYVAELDAAFKSCDAAALATAVEFPITHVHVTRDSGATRTKTRQAKYKAVKQLVAACKKKGSFLKLGVGNAFEPFEPAQALQLADASTPGELVLGYPDESWSWFVEWKAGRWILTALSTLKLTDV